MSDHSLDRIIDDLNGLNEELEHVIMEVEKQIRSAMKVGSVMEKKNIGEEQEQKILLQEWIDYNQTWKGRHTIV